MTQKNDIALITGAGKRIGYHLAKALSAEGWSIAAHHNQSETEARALCKKINDAGGQAIALKADLSKEQDVTSLIGKVKEKLGRPNLLINCASVFFKDELETLEGKTFDEQMAINLKAPLLLSKEFAALHKIGSTQMTANIINITDQRVQNLNPTFFSYTLTKVGLSAATITMAQTLAPNVRVNAIAPGPVLQSIHQTTEEFQRECQGTLLGAGTTPDEIFETVKFILATKSLTGENITLDGGQRLKWPS